MCLSAWFSEAAGRLQAVIRVQAGNWFPDHPPGTAAVRAGVRRGRSDPVCARGCARSAPGVDSTMARGRPPDVFASAGPTTGAVIGGPGGTATIDVPGQTGAVTGAVLANPFVLTYDGDGPIDRAPGGTTPIGSEYGADYVVGSCGGAGAPGRGPAGAGWRRGRRRGVLGPAASARQAGWGRPRARSRQRRPDASAGVPVELTVTGRRAVVRRLTTSADGTFSTSIRAVADLPHPRDGGRPPLRRCGRSPCSRRPG